MSQKLSEITQQALSLPEQEQLQLARTLMENSECIVERGAEQEWQQVIERRIALIDSGAAQGRPFREVLQDIDRRLGR